MDEAIEMINDYGSEVLPRGVHNGYFKIITKIHIEINDTSNKIKFHKFQQGDPWNITLLNSSTNEIVYKFNGTIAENNTTIAGNNWFVYFGKDGALNNGVQKCIFPGTYNVSVNATKGGVLVENNGKINVKEDECNQALVPVPELGNIIFILAGLLGMLLVLKKYRGI